MDDLTVYCGGHGGCEVLEENDCDGCDWWLYNRCKSRTAQCSRGYFRPVIPFTQGNRNTLHLVLSANSATTMSVLHIHI